MTVDTTLQECDDTRIEGNFEEPRVVSHEKPAWEVFEGVVRSIISRHRDFFGLDTVEPGVTAVLGKSGYTWNIDVAATKSGSQRTVIFEVRRRMRNVEPEEMAAIAYKIQDTDSEKGYVVTKLDRGPSIGADLIATFEQIEHIEVAEDSTPESYLMKSLKTWFVGVSDSMGPYATDSIRLLVADKDGNIVREVSGRALDAGGVDWKKNDVEPQG